MPVPREGRTVATRRASDTHAGGFRIPPSVYSFRQPERPRTTRSVPQVPRVKSHEPARILLIRPSALGDVCRSVPVAASLRASFPEARISWLVQRGFEDAVRAHPAVDEVVPFPRRELASWWRSPAAFAATLRFLRSLGGRFDLVVDAQGLLRSGLLAGATRAPRRIGYADAREFGWFFLTERIRVTERHAVERMLALLANAGIPPVPDASLRVPPDAAASWRAKAASSRAECGPYAVLAPTSRWASKDWPTERWRKLAREVLERGFATVYLFGSDDERERIEATRPTGPGRERVVNLAGCTSLGERMAAIAGSSLVVANDSAATHMAVGFARPLLALYGPTDPAESGPFRRPRSVLRSAEAARSRAHYRDRSLGDRLMRGIAVADVLAALDRGDAEADLPVAAGAAR